MNTLALREELTRLGVSRGEYVIGRMQDRALCLLARQGGWTVVLEAGDGEGFRRTFEDEAEACTAVLDHFRTARPENRV